MKIENQVCNPELAKRLSELGVKQDVEYYWRKYSLAEKPELYNLGELKRMGADLAVLSGSLEYEYAAFTVAELGEMLPDSITIELSGRSKKYEISLDLVVSNNFKSICYVNNDSCPCGCGGHSRETRGEITAETEADARAMCLIYLLEKKQIDQVLENGFTKI